MRVLVTGATGYIGRSVAEELVRRGHSVTGLVRGDPSRLPAGVAALRGSLASPADWVTAAAASNDAIVHCALDHTLAADAGYSAALEQEHRALNAMLDAALAEGSCTRALVVTTDLGAVSGYDDGDEYTPTDRVDESMRPRFEFEARLLRADCPRLRTCAVRPAWIYGGPRNSGLLATLSEASKGGKPAVVGDGSGEVSLVALGDLARLYAFVVENETCHGVFHGVSEGNRMSWASIAEHVSKLGGFGGDIIRIPQEQALKEMGFLAAIMVPMLATSKRCKEVGFEYKEPRLQDAFERFYKECNN